MSICLDFDRGTSSLYNDFGKHVKDGQVTDDLSNDKTENRGI